MVPCARRRRRVEHPEEPRDPGRAQSVARLSLRYGARLCVLCRPRLRVAGNHRRGSAVRGHGAFWQARGSPRLVRAGRALACAQLLRPGCAPPCRPESHREPVLSRLSAMGALSDGGAGHCGNRDRFAGDDFRGIFDDAPGHPARLPSAHDGPAYVFENHGPDLRARGELDPPCGGDGGGDRVRLLHPARLGLRRFGDGHHAGHDLSHVLRASLRLALPAVAMPRRHGLLHGGRHDLLCRRDAQGIRRRVVPASSRRRYFQPDGDLEAGSQHAAGAAAHIVYPARGLHGFAVRFPAATGARHGRLPHSDTRFDPARALAQP